MDPQAVAARSDFKRRRSEQEASEALRHSDVEIAGYELTRHMLLGEPHPGAPKPCLWETYLSSREVMQELQAHSRQRYGTWSRLAPAAGPGPAPLRRRPSKTASPLPGSKPLRRAALPPAPSAAPAGGGGGPAGGGRVGGGEGGSRELLAQASAPALLTRESSGRSLLGEVLSVAAEGWNTLEASPIARVDVLRSTMPLPERVAHGGGDGRPRSCARGGGVLSARLAPCSPSATSLSTSASTAALRPSTTASLPWPTSTAAPYIPTVNEEYYDTLKSRWRGELVAGAEAYDAAWEERLAAKYRLQTRLFSARQQSAASEHARHLAAHRDSNRFMRTRPHSAHLFRQHAAQPPGPPLPPPGRALPSPGPALPAARPGPLHAPR